jgi:hypothetical protein
LDEGRYDQIIFSNDAIGLVDSTHPTVRTLNLTIHNNRPSFVEIMYHALTLKIDVQPGTTRIPQTIIFQPDIPGVPEYTFNANWTPLLAANLTIDNLLGFFYVNAPFVPFRPGFLVRTPRVGLTGIRIHGEGTRTFEHGVRVYYPFPDYARLNPSSWGEPLRYEDIELVQPMSLDGDIDSVIFAGSVHFDMAAGINVRNATFDVSKRPSFIIEYRLQGGLPRIYLGTTYAPMDVPTRLTLRHRGTSEKSFIQRHPDWFRRFSHEILCSNESWPCQSWPVVFDRDVSEDGTNDHVTGSSILKTVCRQENEGVKRTCLALEIDEYYFPLRTASPLETQTREATTVPPASIPRRSEIPSKSQENLPSSGGQSKSSESNNAGGGSISPGSSNEGLGIGAGVAIGVAVGVVVAAVVGLILYFVVFRKKSGKVIGYDDVDGIGPI